MFAILIIIWPWPDWTFICDTCVNVHCSPSLYYGVTLYIKTHYYSPSISPSWWWSSMPLPDTPDLTENQIMVYLVLVVNDSPPPPSPSDLILVSCPKVGSLRTRSWFTLCKGSTTTFQPPPPLTTSIIG